VTGAILRRALGFLALWFALIGIAPADAAVGVVAAALATWASVVLLPPGTTTWRWGAVLAALPYYGAKAVAASVDVAVRALKPALDLAPGFVEHPARFPPGEARTAFTSLTSLMPGTIPCADDDGRIVYHCLDAGSTATAVEIANDEARFRAVVGDDAR
jgi:multicomponent Na+:H+ antiporter subunit E